jgi:chorismate-pyruvate lyase
VAGADGFPKLVVDAVEMPLELKVLRDCASASAELERLLGAPVAAEVSVSAWVEPADDVHGPWTDLLAISSGEAVFTRAARLVSLGGSQTGRSAVAYCRMWLAVERVPDSVTRYLAGTNLTLGQALRLAGCPVTTRCVAWAVSAADRAAVTSFGCHLGAPVLSRRMLVLLGGRPVAVTEETFAPAPRAVRRPARRSGAPGPGGAG